MRLIYQDWGIHMHKTLLPVTIAATFALAAFAHAGGMAEPAMDPVVVEEATSSSSQDIVIPLLLLLIIAAVASSGDGVLP